MNKQKALVVIGTRPEAIKMAPVIKGLQQDSRYDVEVCSTGQHQEMLHPILEWFDINPTYQLNVMTAGQSLSHLTGRILNGLQDVIANNRPDIIFVHGDTTTAFVSALAAHYNYDFINKHQIQIAHVEAGLRTYDNYAPFPEEGNRRLIGHLAHFHFAPTNTSAEALFEERIMDNVVVTGNTVIDALHDTVKILEQKPRNPFPQINDDAKIILVTAHRRENYGEGLTNICKALKAIAEKHKQENVHIVYPVHLNPHVKAAVAEHLEGIDNLHLIRPMDYPDFVAAIQRCFLVLTDSGGLQEEAPSLGKPVLVMRDVTERPDAVAAGTVKLVGTDFDRIVNTTDLLLTDEDAYNAMAKSTNPYGDGKAVNRILNILHGDSVEENFFHIEVA